MKTILHIDFNSYFATVEQQANPRLRGKPIGVTGGDRMERTVLGAASVEAKRFGVKTGMQIWQAKRLCPQIILVKGDCDKYLECTRRFLTILKDYSPYLEVFSIDEAFLCLDYFDVEIAVEVALKIKERIKKEVGEYITCSIGISYNKLMVKLAGSLQKPDGLVVIRNQKEAIKVLDQVELDGICGIGGRIKKRLNNTGIFSFEDLRKAPKEALLASFKSYGLLLYNMARGIDHSPIIPFYEKAEVKSIGHRHTIDHDTCDPVEIKQTLLKLTELVARRLRAKNLVGKTVHCWFRNSDFSGEGMQATIIYTDDGLEIFKSAWKIFSIIWKGDKIRMIGVSISNLKPNLPQNLSLLLEANKQKTIQATIDQINNKFGEFTLQRGILHSYLSDRRFKL